MSYSLLTLSCTSQSELRTYLRETSKVTRMARGALDATSRVFATVESWMGHQRNASAMFTSKRSGAMEENEDLRTPGSYANSEMTEAEDVKEDGPQKSGHSASSLRGAPSEFGMHSSFASSAGGLLAPEANFSARVRLAGSALIHANGSPQESFTSESAPNMGPSVKGTREYLVAGMAKRG